MARTVKLTSGSIFNGNPITFAIQPNVITGTDSDNNTVYPSFHRVIIEVTCGMSDGNFETIKMSAPVEKESASDDNNVNIDISSALRTFRDSYEYTPNPTTYPIVKFALKVYDEYMLNGNVKQADEIVYPAEVNNVAQYFCTIFGGFSDLDRLKSNGSKDAVTLSRKPTSSPHLATVGEVFAYTSPYSTAQSLFASASLVAPTSAEVTITKEGQQTIGGQSVYALPQTEAKNRQVFRFINSFGVLESISAPCVYSKKLGITTTSYAVSRQETFNSFSRSTVRKVNNRESWLFITDPLTEEWLYWYLHEFLMSEHIWLQINDTWVPCTITPEDETSFLDNTQQNIYSLSFTAKLDINGSPLL